MAILYYNDQVLNETVIRLLKYNKSSCFNALNACVSRFGANPVFDARYFIGAGIVSCMIHNCPNDGMECTPGIMKIQVENIAKAMPASVRWKIFDRSPRFQRWIVDFSPQNAKGGRFQLA